MHVAWFPKSIDLAGNPYWSRLQQEMEALGVVFEGSHNSYWTGRRWLLQNRRKVHVLHFHFIQPQYIGPGERASLRRLVKFASDLLLAKALGYRIVWTVHDLIPTWPKEPRWVERLARLVIACLAHDVIVHCQEARRLVARVFHRARKVWVLPLPSYADVHPNELTPAAARDCLGIAYDRYVVGAIGGIRPNKGLEDLLAAFRAYPHPTALLLIAGRPWIPVSYVEQLRSQAQGDPRVILQAREIAEEEMQVYLQACDIVAFPFRHVLTSSSVMLAMSFGKPVIVPRMGCLPELVEAGTGFVYEAGDIAGLTAAMDQAARADLATMGAAAATRARQHTWEELARATLEVYRERWR